MESIRINSAPAEEPAAPKSTVTDGSSPDSVNAGPPKPDEKPDAPKAEAPKPDAPKADAPKPDGDKPFVPKIDVPKVAPKIDLSAALTEFGKDGKVSDATYKTAEDAGMSRADVDTYLAGHKSRVEGVATALSAIAGSTDNLKAVMEWAGANTDDATREAFNSAMDRGDLATASLMTRGLVSQYNDAVGTEGERIVGNRPAAGVQPFGSWEQVRKAMADPRYGNDAAYQASVVGRMRVSKF